MGNTLPYKIRSLPGIKWLIQNILLFCRENFTVINLVLCPKAFHSFAIQHLFH